MLQTHLRTHTCGELNKTHIGQSVTLCGWVYKVRELGGMTFVDLRDRYGITQLTFNPSVDNSSKILEENGLTREMVIKIEGSVVERSNKNSKIPTGDIEIKVQLLNIL